MSEKTTCLIVGGGPAGMVAGLLLARGGVEVTVLEKHADFLRDFRGDTVHPSTLRLLDELGLYEQFNALPHTRAATAVRGTAPCPTTCRARIGCTPSGTPNASRARPARSVPIPRR